MAGIGASSECLLDDFMAMWHPGEQIKEVVRVGEGKDYKQVWQLEEDFFFCNAAYVLSSTADSHGPLGKSSASHR